ncbi:MAG TPA: ABC transporter permease [Acidobacteriaceae bacterium]|jgi:hypothetical protein|nr:ABC transporter permease [Acidobacteriaceae bacterium]
MKIRSFVHSFPISLAIIRTAAIFVPGQQRLEWLAEWKSELWHVWQACKDESHNCLHDKEEVTAFCLGAFKDALWLRRNDLNATQHRAFRLGSPSRCGFFLAILAAMSMMLALYLPGARKAILLSPYQDAHHLVMISHDANLWAPYPTIRLDDYQSWTHTTHRLFTGIAFYQPILKRVRVTRHQTAELSIGRASDNLFELLQIPIAQNVSNPTRNDSTAALVLSHAAWHKYFGDDPQIVGHILDVAGQRTRIVGILPDDSWQLPGQMDAWLLEDPQQLASLPSHSKGFVLGHIRPSAFYASTDGQWHMTVVEKSGRSERYDCVSLAEQSQGTFSVFVFALFLACLSLPATTSLPLGEYPVHKDHLPWATRIRRWIFLLTKIGLIVPIAYYGSVALAHWNPAMNPASSQYIQLGTSFLMFLFGFRWALRDQRKRCPVCLRLLTNPARVGQSSRNFLAWNGTELICVGGHGLLHVPDISTSWFSTQRWLYLDPSWSSLFSDASLGML